MQSSSLCRSDCSLRPWAVYRNLPTWKCGLLSEQPAVPSVNPHPTIPLRPITFPVNKTQTPEEQLPADENMAQPRYLTGDKAGIEEFIDKFDVSTSHPIEEKLLISSLSPSYSTAMVCTYSLRTSHLRAISICRGLQRASGVPGYRGICKLIAHEG